MDPPPTTECPPAERLEELVATGTGAGGLDAHVDACPRCRERVAALGELDALAGEVVEAVRADRRVDPANPLGDGAGFVDVVELHRGGQGTVFRARQTSTGRLVAIKVLLDGAIASPRRLRRFEREVELATHLEHPYLVTVYDRGTTEDGRPYFVMEYINGVPTNEVEGRSTQELCQLFVKICDAVNHAHRNGVLHRDLKPENVLVDGDGEPHLLDFGMAVAAGEGASPGESRLTREGEFMGTLAYASPEHVLGEPRAIDARSDVYALGVILYEMLTGHLPYPVDGPSIDVVRAIAGAQPPALARDSELDTIVQKALAKEKDRRYQSPGELARDLERFLAGEPIDARRDSAWYLLRKMLERHRTGARVAALVGVLLVAAGVFSTISWRDAAHAAGLARERADSVLRLSDTTKLARLRARAERLWPADPERIVDYEEWLAEARRLLGRRDLHGRTLSAMRERSTPVAERERNADAEGRALTAEREFKREFRAFVLGRIAGVESGALDADELDLDLDQLRAEVAELGAEIDAIDELLASQRVWRFADSDDEWWHETLSLLLDDLDDLGSPGGLIEDVQARLAFAEDVRELSLTGSEARRRWAEATAAIAGLPAYGGLELEPQLGLLPIGADPDSGLWEFAHLQTGEVPVRDAETRRFEYRPEHGVVLVLVPGGRFWMGAQSADEHGPNFDPLAGHDEGPVHEVDLAPYFLSKFELNQAQWTRATGSNPSQFGPESTGDARAAAPMHPVEMIDWPTARDRMQKLGLGIPTEAQWERACRAGTDTPWCTGRAKESLTGHVNLADRTAREAGADWPQIEDWPELEDGQVAHAPVHAFAPNRWGFHNMVGNVWEWCLDRYGPYTLEVRPGTGERVAFRQLGRIGRGTAFDGSVFDGRSASRSAAGEGQQNDSVGVRPARAVTGADGG